MLMHVFRRVSISFENCGSEEKGEERYIRKVNQIEINKENNEGK